MTKTSRLTKQTRVVIALVVAIIVGMIASIWNDWWTALLTGWDGFVLIFVGLIWIDCSKHDGEGTAKIARRDDMGTFVVDVIVLLASIASLVAVFALLSVKSAGTGDLLLGLLSVIASWLTVHTLYTLRYAALYYRGEEGGVDFNDHAKPRFSDFAYLAFTIGMTYQVSDTNLTHHSIRRAALSHALVSFVFGVVIIATTINLVVSFAGTH